MKRVISVLAAFLGVGFLFCFILGMVHFVPAEVPAKSVFVYKLCVGLEFFLDYLPSILFTGFVISCSVYFGQNPEGSAVRFSLAMGKRYKIVIIASLICTFVLSLSNETLGILLSRKKENIINRPKLIKEYIDVGNTLCDNGLYERGLVYANAAIKLDSSSESARNLKSRCEMGINWENVSDLFMKAENVELKNKEDYEFNIDSQKVYNSYQFLLKALSAFENEEWFDAHYYAEEGIKIASPKEPNLEQLKQISRDAWNNISETHSKKRSAGEKIFEEKYSGYLALMKNEDLQAYYIFRNLNENYPELDKDNDVQFYMEIARKRVEQKYFFIDETLELETFESANDVYFCNKRADGSEDVLFFKGMTVQKAAGKTIQYLRDFYIITLKNGEWHRTLHVPYAKVMSLSVKELNENAKTYLEIDDETEYVPYILLKSVGRNQENQVIEPEYIYADGRRASSPEYLVYPLSYSSFLMLEESSEDPKTLSFSSLYSLSKAAASFGYSQQVFTHIFYNRVLYPIFILILFILVAITSWNYRIGQTGFFKMSWLIAFPFLAFIAFLFYKVTYFLFTMINYIFVSFSNIITGLVLAGGVYCLLFIIFSICFWGCKTE